jgi:hypothetical protein
LACTCELDTGVGAGDVVAHVAEVQRVDLDVLAHGREGTGLREVHPEVPDATELLPGGVDGDGVAVLAVDGNEAELVDDLHAEEVAVALAHRAGVMADARSTLADHPVLDHVAVLVADQRQVVVAVGARAVEQGPCCGCQRYMFVTDEEPSIAVAMLALFRAPRANACGVAIAAPAWASPVTGSFWRKASVNPKFQFCSVKPR